MIWFVEDWSRPEFKEVLPLNIKDSIFAFDGTLYKQFDGVAMDSPSGPLLVNAFLVYYDKKFG